MDTVRPLRIVVFDRTCRGATALPGLSHAWSLGSWLYRARGAADVSFGASSWHEALEFLGTHRRESPIGEIQFWGHGKWGDARIGGDCLTERSLGRHGELRALIGAVADRMSSGALFWLRTCESFGAARGHRFASALADRFGARVAGHTYVIGWWQSGLHRLDPGSVPDWDPEEGLLEGNAARPERAAWSTPAAPRTITCLDAALPDWA